MLRLLWIVLMVAALVAVGYWLNRTTAKRSKKKRA